MTTQSTAKRIRAGVSGTCTFRNDQQHGTEVVTDATRKHERAVAKEYTWPALPPHLRTMPDARAMVRHWVRTDYHWEP